MDNMENQSNAIAAFVAYILTPVQLAQVQQKAVLAVQSATKRSVIHQLKDS
jgi:hypothetical protein